MCVCVFVCLCVCDLITFSVHVNVPFSARKIMKAPASPGAQEPPAVAPAVAFEQQSRVSQMSQVSLDYPMLPSQTSLCHSQLPSQSVLSQASVPSQPSSERLLGNGQVRDGCHTI